jgi:hypothetical protein
MEGGGGKRRPTVGGGRATQRTDGQRDDALDVLLGHRLVHEAAIQLRHYDAAPPPPSASEHGRWVIASRRDGSTRDVGSGKGNRGEQGIVVLFERGKRGGMV